MKVSDITGLVSRHPLADESDLKDYLIDKPTAPGEDRELSREEFNALRDILVRRWERVRATDRSYCLYRGNTNRMYCELATIVAKQIDADEEKTNQESIALSMHYLGLTRDEAVQLAQSERSSAYKVLMPTIKNTRTLEDKPIEDYRLGDYFLDAKDEYLILAADVYRVYRDTGLLRHPYALPPRPLDDTEMASFFEVLTISRGELRDCAFAHAHAYEALSRGAKRLLREFKVALETPAAGEECVRTFLAGVQKLSGKERMKLRAYRFPDTNSIKTMGALCAKLELESQTYLLDGFCASTAATLIQSMFDKYDTACMLIRKTYSSKRKAKPLHLPASSSSSSQRITARLGQSQEAVPGDKRHAGPDQEKGDAPPSRRRKLNSAVTFLPGKSQSRHVDGGRDDEDDDGLDADDEDAAADAMRATSPRATQASQPS